MTGPDRPGAARWPLSVVGSLLIHAAAAAAAFAMVQQASDGPAAAPQPPAPEFSVTLETLAPATLAGVQAVRPDPEIVPRVDPPDALPPIDGPENLPPVDGRAVDPASPPDDPRAVEPAPVESATVLPPRTVSPVTPVPTSPARVVRPTAISPVSPLDTGPGRAAATVPPDGAAAGPEGAPPPVRPVDPAPLIAALPPAAVPPSSAGGGAGGTGQATASGAGGGTADPAPPSVQDLAVSALLDRVASVPGRDCTLALPRRAGSDAAALALIGTEAQALDSLAESVLTQGLSDTPQTRALVDRRQCPVLDWVRETAAYPATRLGLRLDANVVDSGTSLTGIVQGVAGRFLTLLLIDDNGVVQDLGPYVTRSGNLARIDAPVARDGPSRDTRQIVLALSTRDPPTDLRLRLGRLAQDVFTGLPDSLSGGDLAVETVDIR